MYISPHESRYPLLSAYVLLRNGIRGDDFCCFFCDVKYPEKSGSENAEVGLRCLRVCSVQLVRHHWSLFWLVVYCLYAYSLMKFVYSDGPSMGRLWDLFDLEEKEEIFRKWIRNLAPMI